MDKILRITSEKNQQYRVWLESGEKLNVSEDVMVRYRLLKDQLISPELLEKVKTESALDTGYQMALNYLSYQLRSRKEMEIYLREKEIDLHSARTIIKRLEDLKLVDDLLYAQSYVRTAIRTSDKGPIVVRQQLKKRGLNDGNIEQGLLLYTDEEQEKLAKIVAEKSVRRYASKSYKEMQQKIRQHLMTKGFQSDFIQMAIEELDVEKDEEKEYSLLEKQGDLLWERHRKLEGRKRNQKVTQSLFQKGFDFDLIRQYLNQKEMENEE